MRTHGKPGTYTAGGCRCPSCTRAHTDWQRARNGGKTIMRDLYQLPSPQWVRRDWYDDAACSGKPRTWWFPEDRALPVVIHRALEVCATCPVIDSCRNAARHEQFGIWAGEIHRLTPADQRRYQAWRAKDPVPLVDQRTQQ